MGKDENTEKEMAEKAEECFTLVRKELENFRKLASMLTLDCVDDEIFSLYIRRETEPETTAKVMAHMRKGCLPCTKRVFFLGMLAEAFENAAFYDPAMAEKTKSYLLLSYREILARAIPPVDGGKENYGEKSR
jgi:hypothetical protein